MTEDALMDITPAARQGLLTDAKTEAMKAKEDESESQSCFYVLQFDSFILDPIKPIIHLNILILSHSLPLSQSWCTDRRVNEQAKRLDHITRALRIEAPEAIAKKYQEQVEEDRAAFQVSE